jgi:deoxyadenosine/deoxycytidine kinase
MNPNIKIVSIEGNIGSGKSTLLENLRSHYENNSNIIFLKEPVEEWETIKDESGITMLEKFYQDQTKYSFPFQMMAYISRLSLLKKTVDSLKNTTIPTIIISERSLFTDKMVFAQMLNDSGNMEYIQHQIYLKWFQEFTDDYPLSKIIYVKTQADICYSRIAKRSRTGESTIPLEYLINCDQYHEKMLDLNSLDCVCNNQLVLNGNIDIYENISELKNWIQQIENFIHY